MTNLLALTRAASDGRGTTTVVDGLELAYTKTDDVLSLALGSTDSARDILRSLSRTGYFDGAEACLERVENLAINLGAKGFPRRMVRLAGHSLGGAVARRLAVMLVRRGYTVARLETYGEPRGWDQPEPVRLPGARYVCGSDPVPWWFPTKVHPWPPTHLPSPSLIPGPWDHRLSSYERALVNGASV